MTKDNRTDADGTCPRCGAALLTRGGTFFCLSGPALDGSGRFLQSEQCRIAELTAENTKLRSAIKAAGFAVMQTSGDWSIHDVSERGKAEEERELAIVDENIDLEVRVGELTRQLEAVTGERDRLLAAFKKPSESLSWKGTK